MTGAHGDESTTTSVPSRRELNERRNQAASSFMPGPNDEMTAVAVDSFQQALIFDEPALERRGPSPPHLLVRGSAAEKDEARCMGRVSPPAR